MIKFSIITLFPQLYEQFLATSLIRRAQEKNLVQIQLISFQDYVAPGVRVDQPTSGHGSGMIIKPSLFTAALEHAHDTFGPGIRIFFSPQGVKLNQILLRHMADTWSRDATPHSVSQGNNYSHIILVCSRYEGIDERVIQKYADLELSIGDYVLMGGDIPAHVFLEAFLRLVSGVVGKQSSVESDSFTKNLLDYPVYGHPVTWQEQRIPDVLLSGNHAVIDSWREHRALSKTLLNRFDWFRQSKPSEVVKKNALQSIPPHYVAILHTNVLVNDDQEGTTSITPLDIHDAARSCATYGIKQLHMVTPLLDQQNIMSSFLAFWRSNEGRAYNQNRYQALKSVRITNTFDDLYATITDQEGQCPLVIATSARTEKHGILLDHYSQGEVWRHDRPVLIIFGTGRGLSQTLIEKSDYQFVSISGLTSFNHLSVRSAVAITLDRWLGVYPLTQKHSI